jgi:hypothetical protein
MKNIKVPCLVCKGDGTTEERVNDPTDPSSYRLVPCRTCNGFGVLIATELKRVEKWRPIGGVKGDPGQGLQLEDYGRS